MDTGLACYLSLWNNPRALELSAMARAMFETFVISEIIKSYANAGKDTRNHLCYYRDNNNCEIDLIILENGKDLVPKSCCFARIPLVLQQLFI